MSGALSSLPYPMSRSLLSLHHTQCQKHYCLCTLSNVWSSVISTPYPMPGALSSLYPTQIWSPVISIPYPMPGVLSSLFPTQCLEPCHVYTLPNACSPVMSYLGKTAFTSYLSRKMLFHFQVCILSLLFHF